MLLPELLFELELLFIILYFISFVWANSTLSLYIIDICDNSRLSSCGKFSTTVPSICNVASLPVFNCELIVTILCSSLYVSISYSISFPSNVTFETSN